MSADPPATAQHLRVDFKPEISPERLVREVARGLGFWPAGYTDSPCPMIEKLLQQVRDREYRPSAGEVDALLKTRARHCS